MELKLALTVLLMTTIQVVAYFSTRAKRRPPENGVRFE
jgi:hypothetical protein